jgi:enamine deaminase RidA (YjgF/YER057c/UK114 family)
MSAEEKLKELGVTLPEVPPAAGNYVPSVQVGNMLYLSGTLPMKDGSITHEGKVGSEYKVEDGYEAAKVCALNALANIKAAVGSINKVKRIVFVGGFVNGTDGFTHSPQVINGASDLFGEVFGEAGRHARAAVSVNGLPLGAAVEIHCTVEVE